MKFPNCMGFVEFGTVLCFFFFFYNPAVPHLRGSFPWARLSSGPLHPGGLYLGWRKSPTPSTAFDDRMGSYSPSGVESGSMTIGPKALTLLCSYVLFSSLSLVTSKDRSLSLLSSR